MPSRLGSQVLPECNLEPLRSRMMQMSDSQRGLGEDVCRLSASALSLHQRVLTTVRNGSESSEGPRTYTNFRS